MNIASNLCQKKMLHTLSALSKWEVCGVQSKHATWQQIIFEGEDFDCNVDICSDGIFCKVCSHQLKIIFYSKLPKHGEQI